MNSTNDVQGASTTDSDYRASHVAAGDDYDANLQQRPFDAYMAAWEAEHVPALVRELFPVGLERYLDFACGTGRITQLIAPLARQSVAVDLSASMLEHARRKCPQTQFHCTDITRRDLEIGGFDLVSSFRFFGNAQPELREAALTAIVRRLAPGGTLLINSHRNPNALYAMLGRLTGGDNHGMDLTLAKLRALLKRHGLVVTRMQPIGVWLYRARLMCTTRADDSVAMRNERRFSRPILAAVAPDLIVVARKA